MKLRHFYILLFILASFIAKSQVIVPISADTTQDFRVDSIVLVDSQCSVIESNGNCVSGEGSIRVVLEKINPNFFVTAYSLNGDTRATSDLFVQYDDLCVQNNYVLTITGFIPTAPIANRVKNMLIIFNITGSAALVVEAIITDETCAFNNNGEIDLNIDGGTLNTGNNYDIQWSHGPTDSLLTNLTANDYTVAIKDDVGCTFNGTFTIASGDTVSADFTFSNICQNLPTTFTDASSSSSASPLTYEWDFTDGSPITANTQGPHDVSFVSSGSKNVQLVVNNGTCSDTSNQSITVFPSPIISITNDTAICDGQSVQLNVSGGTTYTWLPNDGSLNDVNSPNPIASPTSTTKYYVTATTANGCIGLDSVLVTVNDLPILNPTPTDTTICEGESVQLQVNPGGNYTWSPNTVLSNTSIFNPVASPLTTTVYKVIMTTGVGCSDSTTINVNVTPRPTIGVSPNQTICNGDSLKLTATGGITYLWTPTDGSLSATNIADPFAKPTTTTQYEVEGYDASGCYDSAFVTISVNPTPPLTVSPDDSICSGSSIALSASGANNYLWTPNNGTLSNRNISNPTATPLVTTSYVVRGRNAFNCFSFDTVTITVNPIPSITISTDTAICEGQSIQLLASGASNYSWSPSATLDNNSIPNPTATPVTTTRYVVTGSNGFNCQAADSVLVTLNPLPTLTITSDTAICEGLSIPLSVSGATNYTWSPNDGSLSSLTIANPIATPTATTIYNVVGTDGNNCSNTASVTVTINTSPSIQAEKDTTLCAIQPVQLSAIGGSSYTWSPTSFLDNSNSPTPISTPNTTTTYTVTGTDGNGCAGTDTVTINVFALPNVTVSNDTALCFGGSAQLLANGATSYSWAPSVSLSNSAIPNPIATPASSTTYIVTGTDGNNCSNTDTVTVTINPLPTITTSPNDTICKGESTTLTASGGGTYLWSDAATLSSSTNPSTIASPLIDTRYKVEVTTPQGCIDSAFVDVFIDPVITINIVQNDTICLGDTVTLSAVVANGVGFNWSSNTGNILTPNQLTTKAIPTVTDYYTLTVTNNIGCTNADSIQIVVESSDVLNATAIDDAICFGDSTLLIASGSGSNVVWQQNGFVSSPNNDSTFVNPTTTTTFFLSANTAGGCSAIDTITINVIPLPNGTLTNDTSLCIGNSIQLIATGGSSYDWGTPYKGNLLSADVLEIFPDKDTTYSVKVFNAQGCFDSLSVDVKVNNLPTLTVSNDTTICSGNIIPLSVSGGITYKWSPSLFLNDSALANPTAAPTADITYIVLGTDGNGCINSDTVNITVNPLPTLTLSNDTSICFGESALLNVSGADTYSWTPSASLDDASSATPLATPNDTTTYIVVGTDGNNCSNTDSVTVFVNPLPTITISPNDTICNGDSTLLVATGGVSYTWSGLNVSSPTTPSTFVSPTIDAQYKVEVRTAFGCRDSAFVEVLIDPVISINIIQNDTICLGDSVTLSAIVANGVDFLWTTGVGNILTPSQLTTIAIPTINEFYTLSVTNSIGCTNSDSLFVVVENPSTFVSISADKDSICSGESTLLVASGAANSYTWQQNGFVVSPNNDSTFVNPTSTTDFVVTGSTSNGCNAFDTVTIFVDPIPTGIVSNDTTICIGDTIALIASGGVSYDWGTPYRATTLSPEVLHVFTDKDTTYSVKVFNSLGCYDSLSIVVSINALPIIAITPIDTVCLGDTINLTATASNISASNWTTGAGSIFSPTQLTTDIEPFINEYYKISLTDNNGCSNSDSILVIVESSPNINITAPTDSICEGDSLLLTANGAATNITWIQNGFVRSPNDAATFVNPIITTDFVVRGKTNDGCDAIDSITVFVDPIPVIGLPNDTSICIGDSIILTATGGVNYDWGTPYKGLLLSPNSLQIFPDKDTTYSVVASNSLGCTANATINVRINSLPVIVASEDTSLCENQPLLLNVSGGANYSWSPSLFLNDTASATPTSTPLTDITYIVTGTDVNGCFNSDSVFISVTAAPTLTLNNDTSICIGEIVQLNATGNATNYQWSPSASLSDSTVANPIASPTTTTTYKVLATTGSNCTAIDSVTITVSTVPAITVSAADTICQGDSTQITASGGAFYVWSGGPISTPNSSSTFVTPTVDTRYKVEVTTLTGCFDSAFVDVFIDPIININIIQNDTVCLGDTITLSAIVANGISFNWTTSKGSITTPSSLTTTAIPFVSEDYILTVTNSIGCTNSDSVFIVVETSPDLSISRLNDSLCVGDSILLIASGANNIIWFQNGFVSSPTKDSTYVTPTNTTTFIARGKTTNGCDALDSIQIFVDQNPPLSITSDSTICSGDSIIIVVSGSSNYVWSPLYRAIQISADSILAFPDVDTTYQVTVTTPTGCSQSIGTKIIVNQKPDISISGDTAICLGKTLQLVATSSTASTYTWRELANTNVLGTADTLAYNPSSDMAIIVEVTSIENCSNSDTINISTSGLQNTLASTDTIICAGDSIVLFASGGNNYSWTPSLYLSDTTSPITYTKPLSNITYQVTISTNDGCSAIHTIEITTNPIPAGQLVLNQDSSCFGEAFTATATINAPSTPHTTGAYSFDNGISFKNNNKPTFIPSTSGDTTITVIFKDNVGCTSIVPITRTHTSLTPISFNVDTLVIPSCTPPPGEFRVHSFNGGIAPYSFSLNGGISVITSDTTIKNVLPGTYLISIEDAFGCISDNNLNFISSITFDTTIIHPKCFGESTGSISFSNIQGGLSPYQFSFGDTLNYVPDSIFNNLTAGVKTIFLKDASGCLLQINKELKGASEIMVQTLSKNNINCFGDNDGNISVNINGGTSPYVIARKTEVQNGTDTFTFDNLEPGKDTLFINDAISCTAILAFEITEAKPIKSFARITSSPSGCNSNDGAIQIDSTVGGSTMYEFSINGGLSFTDSLTVSNSLTNISSGVYQLITRDSLFGCTDTLPIFVNASNGLLLDSIRPITQNPNCENLNGAITLTNLLGAPRPYEFKLIDLSDNSIIYNYQSDSTFSTLLAGSYNVVIKDTASCEYFYPIVLKSYAKISSSVTVVESSCGLDNGQVIVHALNGSGNYDYSLQDLALTNTVTTQLDSTFRNLTNDTYIITITDSEEPSCSSSDTAVVTTTSVGLLVKTDTTTCFGASDARVTILDITNADTSFYRFEFSLDDTLGFTEDRLFINLKGGAHTVFIKQIDKFTNQECVYEDIDETANNTRLSAGSGKSFEIPEPQALNAKISTLPSDYGEATGSIFVYEVQGGTGPYSFSINDSLTYVPFASLDSVTNESRGYEEGYHYIFIKDKNGCLLKLDTEVGRTLYIPNIFTPNGDGKNDTFFISNLPETGAKLRVYDRWGVLSFKSFFYENDWDGKNQPDGIYYYELDTPTKIYKGWVQIVRK